MCNVIGCANFDTPPLCTECQWAKDQLTARIAELEAELNRTDSEIPNYKQQLTQANAEIKYLAKNLHEIDSANEGEYQTYTAEQWIEKAKEATSVKAK